MPEMVSSDVTERSFRPARRAMYIRTAIKMTNVGFRQNEICEFVMPDGFTMYQESSIIDLGCSVAMISFLKRVLRRRNPLQHIGGVAQMVRATDS